MKRIRALADPVLDTLLSYSIYTYTALGYIVSSLDYISQVLIVIMLTAYTVMKQKENTNQINNYGYFVAGYIISNIRNML